MSQSKEVPKKRIWEIDLLRALAVLGMIYFHFFYALNYMKIENSPLFDGGWETFGNTIRNTFFIVVGIGMALSIQRYNTNQKPYKNYYLKELKKAGILILIGLAITWISLQFTPDQIIRFGVLSFIGSSVILLLPFIRYGILTAIFTIIILWIENQYGEIWSNKSLWSYILGFYPGYWPSLDYFPIVPWLASVSGGATLAHIIFKNGLRRYPFFEAPKVLHPILWIGKKALIIYLLHLPITIGVIWILHFFEIL